MWYFGVTIYHLYNLKYPVHLDDEETLILSPKGYKPIRRKNSYAKFASFVYLKVIGNVRGSRCVRIEVKFCLNKIN